MKTFFVKDRSRLVDLYKWLATHEPPFKVELKHGNRRTISQNAFLWAVCYPEIIRQGGLDGWHNQDVHEFYLGEWSGWEELSGLGRKRVRPVRRSSVLSKTEFSDYIAFIQQRAAERGIFIPDPEPQDAEG